MDRQKQAKMETKAPQENTREQFEPGILFEFEKIDFPHSFAYAVPTKKSQKETRHDLVFWYFCEEFVMHQECASKGAIRDSVDNIRVDKSKACWYSECRAQFARRRSWKRRSLETRKTELPAKIFFRSWLANHPANRQRS